MSKLTEGQRIALDYHLCAYPDNMDFEGICRLIMEKDERINRYIGFMDWDEKYLCNMMLVLSSLIRREE